MNNSEIKNRIADIIKDCKANINKLQLEKDISLAGVYHKGQKEYFKKRIYELHEEMNNSIIGDLWLTSGRISPFQKAKNTFFCC